ncbi:hypothetical protein H4R34_004834, partial [Dimargaris verticillata]
SRTATASSHRTPTTTLPDWPIRRVQGGRTRQTRCWQHQLTPAQPHRYANPWYGAATAIIAAAVASTTTAPATRRPCWASTSTIERWRGHLPPARCRSSTSRSPSGWSCSTSSTRGTGYRGPTASTTPCEN